MHGVFASQLTIGNTSFHKLFSVSRDAYNIAQTGLRVLAEIDGAWESSYAVITLRDGAERLPLGSTVTQVVSAPM